MDYFRIIGRKQIIIAVVFVAIIALVFSVALSGAASVTTSGKQKKLPIYSVGRADDDKTISISFDAAWGNEDTEILIDILAQRDIKVTFFVVGEWVDKYPESVKALSDAGHEVMNHSDTHPHMPKLSREQMKNEIESCNAKIEAITGVRPTLFRAPYGEYCDALIEVLAELGMYCIQWDVDSLDWKDPAPSQICDRVCGNVCPGSVVLFHNAATNTPAALPTLLDDLLAKGYKFVPISENIYYDNYT
ncbi:MAG: polysaccharide deacetylase family protein, partial [Clostridia bacterium]|nr:polysaccharide deacetylase family protein [Clostridia bacterium]